MKLKKLFFISLIFISLSPQCAEKEKLCEYREYLVSYKSHRKSDWCCMNKHVIFKLTMPKCADLDDLESLITDFLAKKNYHSLDLDTNLKFEFLRHEDSLDIDSIYRINVTASDQED